MGHVAPEGTSLNVHKSRGGACAGQTETAEIWGLPLPARTSSRPQDEIAPEPVSTRICLANPEAHGGFFWSSLPVRANEKLPRAPLYAPVPEPATTGTVSVTWK